MATKPPNHSLSAMRCPMRLEDVDLFGPGAAEHWYEAYDILHREAPVQRIPGEGFLPGTDGFILSRYEDIARVVKDEARFPPAMSIGIQQLIDDGVDPESVPNSAIAAAMSLRPNPAMWRAHRQELTDPWVGPGATRHEAMISRFAAQLLDGWIDEGRVEFVSRFARPLPQMVMAGVLGWPLDDLDLLKYYGDGMVKPFVYGAGHRNVLPRDEAAGQEQVLAEFRRYTLDLIASKRKTPAEDMISFLTAVTYSPLQRKLTDLEIVGVVYNMVIGGLETTQYALAEQVQLLIEFSDVWDALKSDRKRVRGFIEEGMRLRAPTQGLSTRTTSRDEVFQGVPVPRGSLLHLRWAAGNIDPEEWEDPKTLKLDRKAATRHLSFSQGPRVCPGASLSRLEQTIAWNTLLDRIERFEYDDGNTFLHQPGIMLGTLELHLRFARA